MTNLIPILHIINGEHYSGAEKVQDLLSLRLSGLGYDVSIACIKPKFFSKKCLYDKDKIFLFPMRRKFDFKQIIQIARFTDKNKIQIIHTHTPRTALVGKFVSLLTNVPMVHHIHSPTNNDSTDSFKNWFNDIIERLCLINVSEVVTVSDSLKKYMIRRGVNTKKVHTVYNGVPSYFHPKSSAFPKNDQFTIGTVALFRPRKGIEILLHAIAELVQKNHNIRLNAVGKFETTEYQTEIIKLVNSLKISDKINWLGFKGDIYTELQSMDLFVLPSLFGEGTPMVILEAMASGVPVLSTKVEGIPEVIKNYSDGVLVDPGNMKEMVSAIEKFILGEFDTQKFIKKAYHKQSNYYSDVSMAKGVSKIYEQIFSI